METAEMIRLFGPAAGLLGLLLVTLVLWGYSRKRKNREMAGIQHLLSREQEKTATLTVTVARLEEKAARVAVVAAELDRVRSQEHGLQMELRELSSRLATAREKNRAGEEAEKQLAEKEAELRTLGHQMGEQRAAIAELTTVNREVKKQSREQLALLSEAGDRLKREFENLANRIFEQKGRRMAEISRDKLKAAIDPLNSQLGDFRKRVEDVYDKESRDRVSLLTEIDHLKNLNRRISEDAVNLTNALKGDSKVRGNWGEIILERVLEESGMTMGREYDLQVSMLDASGRRYQPDALIRLPGGRQVVIDAKVSLTAWERYCSADDGDGRKAAIRSHVASLRAHFRDLGSKHYSDLAEVNSLDFVLMFVPVEAAFVGAVRAADDIFFEAHGHNIVLVCPSTLMVTLRTIQNLWRSEYQNRNAMEIASRAGDLYDKFVGFSEAMEEMGLQLDRAAKAYRTARNRLSEGRGNLVRRAQALKDLGVQSRKKLPVKLVEASGAHDIRELSAGDDPEADIR